MIQIKPDWKAAIHHNRIRALLLVLLLSACRATPDATTPAAEPTAEPAPPTESIASVTLVPPTEEPPAGPAEAPAGETEEPSSAPSPTPAAEASPEQSDPAGGQTSSIPEPTLFEVAWEDRTPFAAGLIPEAQEVLGELDGASVYHMELEIVEGYEQLIGRQEVLYTNQEDAPLQEIYFQLFPNLLAGELDVASLMVNDQPVDPVLELRDIALRVPLPAPLAPGEQAVVRMDFTVEVPTTAEGNYGSFAFQEGILALAHFYPLIAVYDDEGWNVGIPADGGDIVYADSSFYLVRVRAPSEAVVIGSGVVSEEESAEDMQSITFVAAPMRDFYLVASEEFEVVSESVGGTTINSYAFPDQMDTARTSLEVAVASFESFNARLGTYPFTEFDIAATPNQALGIEYPGVVVITNRLYQPGGLGGGAPNDQLLEGTVAHEAGHQWFYSLVGNDQLDEPWLDESLTQYITYVYYRDRYGEGGANGFRQSLEQRWARVEEAAVPVGLPVSEYTPIEYSAIVYGRGPLFFIALEEEMGQEAFDAFLRNYSEANRFGIGTGEEMKALAEEHCGCDLTPIWEEWITEE